MFLHVAAMHGHTCTHTYVHNKLLLLGFLFPFADLKMQALAYATLHTHRLL